jgi:hypothetical protein
VPSLTTTMPTSRLVRRLALPLALAGVLGTASPALACDGSTVQSIVFQAAKDGHVRDGYAVTCLRQALQAQPADLLTYSSSDSAIRLAIAEAAQTPRGSAQKPIRVQQSVTPTQSDATTVAESISTGPLARLINAPAHSPGAVPVPVIILGAVAFLLLGGGVASVLVRRRLGPARTPHQR